mgnify:CR=1 FL=1
MADKKQKILIVDDSEMNRDILAVMLGSDYEILEAENGLEAIEILQQGMTDIDLILLDIMMPEMDGFDVLGFMKRSHMTEVIPVINTLMLYAKQKRLVQMVADQVYEREKNNDMMVNILSHIVEFRNGESGQHVRNIHMMTEILLQHLQKRITKYQITQEDIVRIATASALHDIGKISIPDTILNKPGKLTKEEYEIVKTHSMAGAQMLDALPEYKDTPFVKTAYEICRWHHERYDGKGYPDGLNGEEIPISAQIVSVADVYDALTSERCYKKSFSHEKAMEMILNGECGQFSPLILECLQDSSQEIQENLCGNPTGKTSDKQVYSVVEEILEHKDIGESSYSGNWMERNWEKAAFFNTWSNELQFDYNSSTGMIYFSDWGAALLGLTKNNIDLGKEKQLLEPCVDVEQVISRIKETCPEKPEVTMDVELHRPDGSFIYELRLRSLWTKEETSTYTGTIGVAKIKSGKKMGGGQNELLYLCQSRCPEVPADKDRICRLQNISCDLSLCGNRWKGICFRDGNRDPG